MKKRIDLLLVEKYHVETIAKAQAMIMAGQVFVVGKKVKNLAKTFSFRIKTYNKSFQINFNDIKKPIKRNLFEKNVDPIIVDNFVKYLLRENKKIHSIIAKKIFIKDLFKAPR